MSGIHLVPWCRKRAWLLRLVLASSALTVGSAVSSRAEAPPCRADVLTIEWPRDPVGQGEVVRGQHPQDNNFVWVFTRVQPAANWSAFRVQRNAELRSMTERENAAAEDVQRRVQAASDNDRAYRSQLASALVPLLATGRNDEWRAALEALATIAPSVVKESAGAAAQRARSADDKAFIARLIQEASERELERDFYDRLNLAREFFRRGLSERACSEFLGAWNHLPSSRGASLDYSAIVAAGSHCSSGAASSTIGAAELQRVFRTIQTY